jgi:hypothetical protein
MRRSPKHPKAIVELGDADLIIIRDALNSHLRLDGSPQAVKLAAKWSAMCDRHGATIRIEGRR